MSSEGRAAAAAAAAGAAATRNKRYEMWAQP